MNHSVTQSLQGLDADIALLADVLDETIVTLAGTETLELVNRLRDAAIALRDDGLPGGRAHFSSMFDDLDLDELELVARVFTQWFHLVNAAEEQHRVRVLRRRDRPGEPVDGSIAHACARLAAEGLSAAEVRDILAGALVMPVLTAHPTEARRRTVLDHLAVIASALERLDTTVLGHHERLRVYDTLRDAVLALFGTEESRASKPRPRDEIETGISVFEGSLLEVTPSIYRAIEDALAEVYPDEPIDVPSFMRWGTWIGGDRDGNPFVTADVTRLVLERHRTTALDRYVHDVDELMRMLSVSSRRLADHAGLEILIESLHAERERLPEVAARALRYTVHEPWREKLWYVRARLLATRERGEAAYVGVGEYIDDLRLIAATLSACGYGHLADGRLRDAIRRADVFGFHLASLDLRQHSAVHERAVAELLATDGVDGYMDMSEAQRCELLSGMLERADLRPPAPRRALSAETREVLATLEMVGRARRELGPEACERYVVSFTSAASDLLEVLFLTRAARLGPIELRPVPLLEQLEDLDAAADIAEQMVALWPIRAALGGELEVMIGYSDAGKQIGYVAASVALRRAQLALAAVADRHGMTLTIFHGRGGTIGRGGGPANRAIRAQPAATQRGRLRVTEQGETVTSRYGRAAIARRDLEQMVHAVLVACASARNPISADELRARNVLFDAAADDARAAYARLLEDPDRLAAYAVAATPIQQVAQLPIGSRPASRRKGLSFTDLRAIPWVFSWNQSRHGLPGWFGLGSALEGMIGREGIERVRDLYRLSPFFRALINNAQLALTRADIDVARSYANLADDSARGVFALIEAEHGRTMDRVLEVIDRHRLLGNAPHLMETVRRRNPYVDVLSHAQIELLRRLRSAEEGDASERVLVALFITINGIAAGLQTAG